MTATSRGPELAAPGDARLIDRGYRRYDGPRLGSRGAQRALYTHSLQRAFGLRRGFRHKVIPLAVVGMAYLPAAVFVGVVALVPETVAEQIAPRYASYYGFVTAAILLFVAAVVPDVLCTDRRTGMLGLYMAAPLTRDSYLATKAAAIFSAIALITVGPPLLMLIGYSFVDLGPSWPREGLVLLIRMIGSGALVALWYAALGIVVAALTDRRAFASAIVVLATLVSKVVATSLVELGHVSSTVRLIDLSGLPFEGVSRIYDEAAGWRDLGNPTIFAGIAAWLAVWSGFAVYRYRRLAVTK